MSGIVLSASVRQNLLSLQSTADLLATTQNRLATGKKVNSALDNPTNFFTAQSLDNRAGDINNLLDGIGNGVQVLQAANTGITTLQKLVDNAKSVANQVLQSPVGFSAKSSVTTTAIAGATPQNLLGSPTTSTNFVSKGSILDNGAAAVASGTTTLAGTSGALNGSAVNNNASPNVPITAATRLVTAPTSDTLQSTPFANGDTFTINGKTVTISTATPPTTGTVTAGSGVSPDGNVVTDGNGNSTVFLTGTANVGDVLQAFDLASGVKTAAIASGAATITTVAGQTASTVGTAAAGKVTLQSTTGSDLNITASRPADLTVLGFAPNASNAITATRAPTGAGLATLIQANSTLTVDGKTITFQDASSPSAGNVASGSGVSGGLVTDGNGNSTVFLRSANINDVLNAIDLATGVQAAAISSGAATLSVVNSAAAPASSIDSAGKLNLSTGLNSDLTLAGGTGNALSVLGLTAGTTARTPGPTPLGGLTLTIGATGGGTATNITFGTGVGQVQSLNDLNNALAANNLEATINSAGNITITTTNDAASQTIGAIGGTAAGAGKAFVGVAGQPPVLDPTVQSLRAGLVSQYNNILSQITSAAQDSSFNGVNLLTGDALKLTFDESGKSVLNIQGVTFDTAGLSLSTLTAGTDFLDSNSATKVLTSLNAAGNSLRTEASTLGSNLSIVQIRQDFNKNLINVLQTGSANLTIADTNEEAANSQALSTRQSIAVSALALANQSQQSVLQLLR
jgi:flagellin